MTKSSIIDLTKNNREHYQNEMFGKMKNNLQPQVLLSIYVDEEGKVEEVKILDEFIGEERGHYLRIDGSSEDFDADSINYNSLPPEMNELDTLYHVYASIGSYRSSYEYDEWDTYYEFYHPIKVMRNYSQFIQKNEDWAEQQKLKKENDGIKHMYAGMIYGKKDDELDGFNGGSILTTNISMRDIKDFISIVAEKNIRLAHRFALHYELREALGDKHDKEIEYIEEKRQEFIRYLKYTDDIEVRWNTKGYTLKNEKNYKLPKGEFFISFEEINNLSDDKLDKFESLKLLEAVLATKHILEAFEEEEEHIK